MKKIGKLKTRSAAFAIMAGLAMGTIPMVTAPVAAAQEGPYPTGDDTSKDYDSSAPVTLTIHKYTQERTASPGPINEGGEALETAPENATPVEGVVYTVKRLKGSTEKIKTYEGQKELTVIADSLKDDPTTVGAVETEGNEETGTTGSDGSYTFTGLPQGAYLVQETDVSGAKNVDGTLVAAPPFIVFLPMTNKAGDTWNYDVNAYPKNTVLPVKKKFDNLFTLPQAANDLSYVINAGIPKVEQGRSMKKYQVIDNLPNQLQFKSLTLRIAKEEDYKGAGNQKADQFGQTGTKLEEGTDYNLEQNGQAITATFTPTGLAKLDAAQAADDRVQALVITEVTAALEDGTTQNNTTLVVNNGSGNGDTTVDGGTKPGPTYAKLKITKITDDGQKTPLADAEFELHWCEGNEISIDRPDPISTMAIDKGTPSPTVDDEKTKFVTGQDGIIEFQGLQKLVSDSTGMDDGALNNPNDKYKYCLKELKAPAGFALRKEPFIINGFGKDALTTASLEAEVPNTKKPDTFLPSTGGAGVLIFGLIGMGALGGIALLIAAKRRKEESGAVA